MRSMSSEKSWENAFYTASCSKGMNMYGTYICVSTLYCSTLRCGITA